MGINQTGTPPAPSDCTVQFTGTYISAGSGITIGATTSSGAIYSPAKNNTITLPTGNYLITYGLSNTNQTDFAFTTNISSLALAELNAISGSRLNGQVNRSFSPITFVYSVTAATSTIYLCSYYLNPVSLGSTLTDPALTIPFQLAYLSILKIN